MSNREVAIVSIAEMYLHYFKNDHALSHVFADPRAREVTSIQQKLWSPDTAKPMKAWSIRGLGTFSLSAIHYWKHAIDFDYLDIGTNVGMTAIGQSIFFQRCGHPETQTYAFEPGPIFDLLKKSVAASRLADRITCVNAAASDQLGRCQFYVTSEQSPASSLIFYAT